MSTPLKTPPSDPKTTNDYLTIAAATFQMIADAEELERKAAKKRERAAAAFQKYPWLREMEGTARRAAKKDHPDVFVPPPKKEKGKKKEVPEPAAASSTGTPPLERKEKVSKDRYLHFHTNDEGEQRACRKKDCKPGNSEDMVI